MMKLNNFLLGSEEDLFRVVSAIRSLSCSLIQDWDLKLFLEINSTKWVWDLFQSYAT